jgi:hypothetical protein
MGWDCESQFWEDVLTHHLWQIFTRIHDLEEKLKVPEAVLVLERLDLGLHDSEPEPCMKTIRKHDPHSGQAHPA